MSLTDDEILAKAAAFPLGHDLTLDSEHTEYMALADELYEKCALEQLRKIEKTVSEKMTDSFKTSTRFHIALKNAISKKLFEALPAMHCTVVFALYKENNRILPKGEENDEKSAHPNGENFVRRKHKQMSWLFANRKADCSWTLLGVDDGCPMLSSDLMEGIAKSEGFDNVTCHRLKEAIIKGECPMLDNEKLKSEAWTEDDKLVKASQKAGAILYGLGLACEEGAKYPGKKHIIAYTDSDLSTDLGLCGLNFDTIVNGKVDCSVSQRFGQACAVNCSKLLEEGGIAPGLADLSIVHLSLRHKLRLNLLPPLAPIIDSNCGHKAITAEAVKDTISKVRDYKGSFDMDWLMCVGICGKAAGRDPIGVTAIPWVNSVGESNFWGGGGGDEDPEAAKLKSATSWHKIFGAITQMHDWHRDDLEKNGLLTDESKAYVEWVKAMDVQQYMRLSDAILKTLEGKALGEMPEPAIMALSLDELKKLGA